MEAAIRSHQVGTGQQSAQQPQSDLSGVRGSAAAGPPQQHPPHSMSQYSQPRSNASGISEVHRTSATSSPYQISHTIPHTYVDQRNRVRPNTFSGASANSKTNYNWQPNAQFEYAPRTTLHQPTNFVSASYAAAQTHGGFAPRVSVSIPQQPPSQQPQSVQSAPRQLTEYITASIRDNATAAALLQATQTNQQRPQPDPGGTQQQQQSQQQTPPSIQPAYKKIRLGEPSPYQPPQTNSLHHPAAAPTSIPVRLHHAPSYDKSGQSIQSNSPIVVQVASTPRLHQNPIVGATAEIQYQPQKPPQQQPTHQIPTAASPQAPQSQNQQQPPPSQQSQQQNQQQSQSQAPNAANSNTKVLSVLKIDTRDPLITGSGIVGSASSNNNNSNNVGGYHPKTEAISPAGSPKLSKDDLLQQISSVDSSMMSLEERKRSLKEKERTLLEQKDEGMSIEVPEVPFTHRTLAQQIYAENKKKANDSHAILTALNFKGQTFELPLYNQPSDADVCRKIHEHYLTFRSSLLLHLRKIKSERAQRNQELADKYAKLSIEWQKRVEKIESSIKRKNREFKNRELFEKVFVELRKQREDKERFNRVGSRVKSEADFEVIVDGLQEQAQEDKKMRSYAVIPPIMFDARQRRLVFQNDNGSHVDMEAELSAYKTLNLWTTGEKEIFRDKYVQQAKNFGFIASNLERKNAQDCVRYYYLSKKDVKYKQLLRKSSKRTRSTKNLPKTSESQSLLDLMTTGVTTRLQRKSRSTTSRPSNNSSSAAASAAESQTTNSNSAARSSSTTTVTSAPLPTVTVTVSGNMKSEEPENENDPLGMTETTSPSPASNTINNNSNANNNNSRRASSNGNVDTTSSAVTATTTSTTNASFLPANIKTEPDGDVVMKTESDSNSNNWSTHPLNGLKHEIKTEEIKMEGKAVNDENNTIKKDEIIKDEKKIDIKKEPNDDKENDEGKSKKSTPMDVDDENSWNSSEPSSAKKRRIDDSGTNELDKLLYPCFVCKQENCSRTRPLEKTKAQQYGLNEDNIPTGARVCNNCQCKAVKSRFSNTNCPLPTCPNPKDRVKRFRNLPARLFELAPEERDPIIKELQIPPNVTKCCSACLTRIKRKMGAHLLGTTSLSDDEIQQLRNKLQDIGPKWSQLADQLNKSATVLKTFYYNYKKKYGFDQAVNEYYKMHANEDRRAITDGDESDVSVTSSDDNGSDTHKNELNDCEKMDTNAVLIVKSEPLIISSTPTSIASMSSNKDIVTKNEPQPPTTTANTAQVQVIDDRLPPPLGQPPPLLSSQQIQNLSTSGMSRGPESHPLISIMRTKKHSEEYDSSATETADEENESSPANRQSPKAVFAGKGLNPATTISMVPTVPPQQQNGPLSNVRDVLHNVIERTLKNPGGAVPPLKHNPVDTNPDVSFVSAYRQDPNKIQIQPQRRSNSDSGIQTLATLSIVNSHGQQQNIPGQNQLHPLNISSIAATITPVPPPPQANQQLPPRSTPQHMIQQDKDMKYHTVARAIQPQVQHNEPEPQTLDLSIKKPQQQQQQPPERNFPAFQAKAPPPPTAGSIYRGDPAANIPNQSNYLAFHPDQRPSKSPSNYIPPPLSPGQRVMGIPPPHSMQQPQQIISNKSKVTPKLSPNVHHQMQQQQTSAQVQQMNGPKGSITKGTPINDRGQPITIQNARYEILRHTPPSAENKFGSIIAGTPVNINDKRVHEYMKNNRHSPATNQQNPTSAAQSGSPHPTITYRPPGDLSSTTRDLVFSDYMISQQMHNQQVRGGANMPNTISIISGGPSGRPEKESPSPRSIAHSSSPASLYYADKDRDRVASGQTRPEYLSRSSPADHHNSNPSPHRTPPPQRQGVIIQRHNNASSKPPSPAPLRQGHFSHHYSQGHDALSNLVDVAVAQQALPVPNDNSRRPSHMPPTSSAENLSSLPPPRDRGYPYLIPAEVMALQHQQIDLMRRQQQHEYNERKERELIQERERDRERNRERDERETQRRIDADLAERNFERDRMEQQLRISYQPRLPYTGRLPDEISAQCLINAIITENISRPADARERYPSHPLNRLQPSENNGNSHSPNVINVDVDSSSDLSRHSSISSLPSKNLKLNDITDAIIAKDPAYMHHQQGPPTSAYHLPAHLMRTSFSGSIPSKTPPTQSIAQQQQSSIPQPMGQEQIVATEQWKINRKLQQQQQQKEELAKSGVNMQGRSTPDERHVIRMAQSPSPRTKMAYEPVSPPETSSHYHIQPKITINAYDQRNMPIVQENAQGADENKLLKLINNRLAEVMRNDDKYPNEHHSDGKDRRDGVLYERPRSGNSVPGNGINSGDKSPAKRESPQVYGNLSRPSSQPGNMPFQPSPSMSFLYPYSALTIPQAAGANPIISPKAANEIIDANRQQQPPAPHLETRQVLSENYDALSDED